METKIDYEKYYGQLSGLILSLGWHNNDVPQYVKDVIAAHKTIREEVLTKQKDLCITQN